HAWKGDRKVRSTYNRRERCTRRENEQIATPHRAVAGYRVIDSTICVHAESHATAIHSLKSRVCSQERVQCSNEITRIHPTLTLDEAGPPRSMRARWLVSGDVARVQPFMRLAVVIQRANDCVEVLVFEFVGRVVVDHICSKARSDRLSRLTLQRLEQLGPER